MASAPARWSGCIRLAGLTCPERIQKPAAGIIFSSSCRQRFRRKRWARQPVSELKPAQRCERIEMERGQARLPDLELLCLEGSFAIEQPSRFLAQRSWLTSQLGR